MARLPQPGGDNGNWGDILNDYLSQSLKSDGTLKDNLVNSNNLAINSVGSLALAPDSVETTTIANGSITEQKIAEGVVSSLKLSPSLRSDIDSKLTVSSADLTYSPLGASAAALMSKLDAGRESASIVILGDSTGDETNVANRWPRRVAQWLANRYPQYTVNFRHWDKVNVDLSPIGSYSALGSGKSEVIQIGSGTANGGGPFVLEIYNGSASGSSPSYNLSGLRWEVMAIPVNPTPDLVFLNHGHNASGANGVQFRYSLLQLIRAVQSLWPQAGIIATAQNPMKPGVGDYTLDLVRARAVINLAATEGLGLVNILQTYLNNANYANELLNADGLHPNDNGSAVWAAEVVRQLRGTIATTPRSPQTKVDTLWVPATQFRSYTTGMTTQTIDGVVNDSGYMIGFPASQLSGVVADIAFPSHWTQFDAYLLWCVASTTGKTASTVVSWRLLRQVIAVSKRYPIATGVMPLGSWVDPGVQSRNPSNGSAYQTISSLISQQSTLTERVQAIRLQRNGNNGTDNIPETAYVRGILFAQAT